MGAIQGTDLSHPLTVRYLNKYQTPRLPFNRDTYFYEYTTGRAVASSVAAALFNPTKVATAVQTYITLWKTYSQYLKPGFPNGIPPALSMTLENFLQENNLMQIRSIFHRVMTLYGYGSIDRVPAVYALVLITDKVFGGSVGLLSNPVWLTDFPLMLTKLAADVKTRGVQFIYNAKISQVIRGTAGVSIKYSVNSISYNEQCDKLVVAFPQKLDSMSFLGLDARETAVFEPVDTQTYIVSMVNTNMNIGSRFYANLLQLDPTTPSGFEYGNAKALGQPIQFARQYPAVSNITTVYSWTRSSLQEDTIMVNPTTIATLQKIDPTQKPQLTTSSILKTAQQPVYFPHVRTPYMKQNWYNSFEQLQGYRNTYYTSGLRFFELIESSIASSQDLARKYF